MRASVLVVVMLGSLGCGSAAPPPALVPHPHEEASVLQARASFAKASSMVEPYREVAGRIIAAAKADAGAWQKLAHLADRIGARPPGSKALEQAVAWAVAAMKADGHDAVRAEEVMVPVWVRGPASARIVAPVERQLALLALGGSGATRRGGVKAEVVIARSLEEIDALGERARGKIVLLDRAMKHEADGTPTYGDVVDLRGEGPARAAKLGAVAALFRSATTRSLRTPHTGATHFDGVRPIPAAAIATEDADHIARLVAAGERVVIALELDARALPDARSANVVGELRGRERPDELVVIGAHLDSWDVGQGAHDDGAGVAACMQALTLLRQLGLTPRRTIRVVLWTNEEHGLRGAKAYAAAHAAELGKHVLAVEMDTGGFPPRGFRLEGAAAVTAVAIDLAAVASLLAPIGADRVKSGYSGSDLAPLVAAGVPALGLDVDSTRYFDFHHSEADTLDKVDPAVLALDVAALAVLAYVVADLPERLGGGAPAAVTAPR